ncbi:WD repeat-containing protein on Y chromosome isoform X1 [Anastrepha ludens]|uniref:WD repeat-containing protein on Y chromosome isoform X1 n=1 Tax=Anastrepha ludens TaxID=28586 RepID=UPI0023AF13D9|nr:WD repeat-containing protein on Y chromosome isoform X1 [Anastrepha ludens]
MSSKNDSFIDEEIDYQTVSTGHSISIERPERLHEWLKAEDVEYIRHKFISHPLQKLNLRELRDVLDNLNIRFTDIEYNRLFLKINQNRDFLCDWNEFISYLIFGFQEDDPGTQKEALILPISTAPVVKKSEHRSPICSISLLRAQADEVDEDDEGGRQLNVALEDSPEACGMWITASREGQIRFWSNTLEPLRTSTSESIHLKMSTWILQVQALSDVSIVCTSSTERELRFHETVASTFTLRIVIRSLPFAVCSMSYSFHPKGKTNSKLVLGDFGGNVRILEFTPFLRGPFQSKPGAALVDLFWADILKGKLPLMAVREYANIHSELIQNLYFSIRMNSLFVSAEYRNAKKYRGRCPGLIIASGEDKTYFRIPMGVTCFSVAEKNNIVVTGGPDTFVRIWDVYISSKPSGILTGHNGGIVYLFVQPEEKKVYSVDYQKIIKVWHMTEYTLLQTFGDLVRILSTETDLCYMYHPLSRDLLVGGRKLISIKSCPRIRVDLTDGNTHAAPVSVVLYNGLFRNVVTCGLDSYIIVWDPWTGRRKIIMKSCHTKMVYGETIDIEITAACFDPLEQFLLTGARDGSLKIWNYNNAVCIRNMSIKPEHEVTAVIWVVERILAVGWDQQVTEFNDVEGREYGDPKKWIKFHNDDVTCADVKLGEGVVTATYSGELIFWKLETGQPYRRYSVADPTQFIELKHRETDTESLGRRTSQHLTISRYVRKSIGETIQQMESEYNKKPTSFDETFMQSEIMERLTQAQSLRSVRPVSVQAVLFLQTRPMTKEHGSVFVALDTGIIQVYSHHQRGGYLKEFNSSHRTGDCVLTMATDRKNRYLFTGTAFGYIKIWHIANFCIPEQEKQHVCMPLLRLQFIFLRKERFLTRAKRMVRYQREPMLLSSYKAHIKAINSIVYINTPKILLTGSHDCSCRLWSLGGRYLGTLGTPLPWLKLSPFETTEEDHEFRMPPDIKKVASSTTMKVITGIQEDKMPVRYDLKSADDDNEDVEAEATAHMYSKPLKEPILGKYFELPGNSAVEQRIDLDTSLSYIPVFTHLKIHEADNIERPPTPPTIRRISNEDYMEFYNPKKKAGPGQKKRDSK